MEPHILEHILDGREKPTNLPLTLLKNITGHFSEDRIIGRGGFATVYKGVLPNGNVAVKRIRNNHSIDDTLFYREVDSLLTTSHQNIVRFLGFCASTDQTAIKVQGSRQHIYAEIRERLFCFEYISNGSLQKYITDELRGLERNTRYQIIRGICEGLHHLHKEKHIYHMDLKPDNILLDDHMVPKITDFGLSRLDEKSQTISENRFASLGYCAPEYLSSGKMSFKSDIFSLGIIITQLVMGHKGILDNKNNVLRRWKHRWNKSGSGTPLVYQQVAKCLEIGLLCQEFDPSKRPFIWELIHDIREMEGVDGTIGKAYEYISGQISPYSEDDMLGVEPLEIHFPFEINKQISSSLILTNQTDAYMAFNIQNMSPLPYCTQPTKGIVPPRSKWSVDITLHLQDKAPRDMQRANEFIVWSTKVNDGLVAEDITMNMFSTESGVVDAMNLDVVFDAEENTKLSKELIPRSFSEDMSNNETDGIPGGVMKSKEWTSTAGTQYHQEATKESSVTQQASKKPSEVIPGSRALLDVHPLELRFRFEPNKFISCSLDLMNNTNKQVAFGLLVKSGDETCLLTTLPMFGILDPGTTYTLVVTLDRYKNIPQERILGLILQTSTYDGLMSDVKQHFQRAEELGNIVHRLTMKGVCALQGDTIVEHSIPPSIQVMPRGHNKCYYIKSMDTNHTEPLIITCSLFGGIYIWNYDTQKYINTTEMEGNRKAALSVKFIARKGLFVAGCGDGFIRVYNYKKNMEISTSFKTDSSESGVYSLAIHPTKPYVLSSSNTAVKLFNWEGWFGWKCMQTFEEHSVGVRAVVFNPEDYNSFASGSFDGTIKVWSLDSPKSKYTLSEHSWGLTSLDFFTRDGQQYLITGSADKTAKIWELQEKTCVRILPHRSTVRCVLPHPKLPVLVTGTQDGLVYLWSSVNFRLTRILNIGGLKDVQGLACLIGSGRVVVAHKDAVSMIEIRDEEQGSSSSSSDANYKQYFELVDEHNCCSKLSCPALSRN